MSRSYFVFLAGALALGAVACSTPDPQAQHVAEVAAAGGTIDSFIPIAERLRRFRETVADHPDTLRRASRSVDALVRRWAEAVQRRDTASLNAMVLDRAEFAWLYYPTARLSKPPYEMPPALLWEQVLANSDDGARKTLGRLGGHTVVVQSVRCPAPPDTEGSNLLRQDCVVQLRAGSETLPEQRYFGSIIEREGRFKFLGYSSPK